MIYPDVKNCCRRSKRRRTSATLFANAMWFGYEVGNEFDPKSPAPWASGPSNTATGNAGIDWSSTRPARFTVALAAHARTDPGTAMAVSTLRARR